MPNLRKVMLYTGLNIHEALQLPVDIFQLSLKNYIIEDLEKTEEGRQYLADCRRYTMEDADIGSLERHGLI